MKTITITITEKNVGLFSPMQHITKTPEIGSVVTVVKQERPYTNKRGYFAVVTDLTPNKNTLDMIARANEPDAKKYGWDRIAKLSKQIIEQKKLENWYAFNRWYVDQTDLKTLLKRSN